MQINIYKDRMQKAHLFGAPVLYSDRPIPREDVPQGWYCYDLRGTAEDPRRPYSLVDQVEKNHAGSVLSYLPLKSGRSQSRLVKDMFQLEPASNISAAPRHLSAISCAPLPPRRRGFSMPRRRRAMRNWEPLAMSASTSGAVGKASTIPGGPGVPRS